MCGSVFRMDIAKFRGTFELQAFIEKLRRKLTSGELDDSAIDYHVGVDRSGGGNVVQVIFVDRGEYGEKSLHLMDSLRAFFEKQFSTGKLRRRADDKAVKFHSFRSNLSPRRLSNTPCRPTARSTGRWASLWVRLLDPSGNHGVLQHVLCLLLR